MCPAPFPGRCVRNAHGDRWLGREMKLLRHVDEESAKYAAARQAGGVEIAAVIAGDSAGLIHDVLPARELVVAAAGLTILQLQPAGTLMVLGARDRVREITAGL